MSFKEEKKLEKGKLIVIEGIDSSGKATQAELLFWTFKEKNKKVMKIEFPDYESPSSSLIKMYLNGDFGQEPEKINPYAASIFFAADRFASYEIKWKEFYNSGGIIICDRYVSSNMIYQASKFEDENKREEYFKWIYDLEFNKLNLPKPDIVIFLSMPIEYCRVLLKGRPSKITGKPGKDIHEANNIYMQKVYKTAAKLSKKYSWFVLDCVDNDSLKSKETINKEIVTIIEKYFQNKR